MELTGAIRQTNEAPNVRTLGHQSHRSPAISTRTPCARSVLAALAADCRLLTTANPRLRCEGKVYERSSHNGHGISPQFILSSLFILRNPTGCTTIAAPPRPVPAITRFKSLSHQLFVDLSVLRLILQVRTGVQMRAPMASQLCTLCQPSYAIAHNGTTQPSGRIIHVPFGLHCPICTVYRVPVIMSKKLQN